VHPEGWWLHIFNNGTEIQCAIAPTGDIAASSYSGLATVVESASTGTTLHFAEYDDAILIGVKHSTGNYWQQGLHAGKIFTPFNASDPAIFVDGFGILGGIPNFSDSLSGSNTRYWANSSSTVITPPPIRIRVSENLWSPRVTISPVESGGASGDLVDQVRLSPRTFSIPISVAGITSSPGGGLSPLGFSKYLRIYKTNLAHRTTVPAINSADKQSWLAFNYNASTRTACCLWNKDVTP
jgi:hypothetical protein